MTKRLFFYVLLLVCTQSYAQNKTLKPNIKYPELAKQFDAILLKEHQPAHIKEWEFVNPKL